MVAAALFHFSFQFVQTLLTFWEYNRYSQAGTPSVKVTTSYDPNARTFTLKFRSILLMPVFELLLLGFHLFSLCPPLSLFTLVTLFNYKVFFFYEYFMANVMSETFCCCALFQFNSGYYFFNRLILITIYFTYIGLDIFYPIKILLMWFSVCPWGAPNF